MIVAHGEHIRGILTVRRAAFGEGIVMTTHESHPEGSWETGQVILTPQGANVLGRFLLDYAREASIPALREEVSP